MSGDSVIATAVDFKTGEVILYTRDPETPGERIETRVRFEHALAASDLLTSGAAFLAWFEVFIGPRAMAEINCPELDALRAAIVRAGGSL